MLCCQQLRTSSAVRCKNLCEVPGLVKVLLTFADRPYHPVAPSHGEKVRMPLGYLRIEDYSHMATDEL